MIRDPFKRNAKRKFLLRFFNCSNIIIDKNIREMAASGDSAAIDSVEVIFDEFFMK